MGPVSKSDLTMKIKKIMQSKDEFGRRRDELITPQNSEEQKNSDTERRVSMTVREFEDEFARRYRVYLNPVPFGYRSNQKLVQILTGLTLAIPSTNEPVHDEEDVMNSKANVNVQQTKILIMKKESDSRQAMNQPMHLLTVPGSNNNRCVFCGFMRCLFSSYAYDVWL